MGPSRDPDETSPCLPPQLAESTPYLLTRAMRLAARLAPDFFAGEPLRFPHYAALCWIEHLGICSQRELARVMDVDPSDLVTIVTGLEDGALLRRDTDPSDRRRNLLATTDTGRAWLRERHARARHYDATLCAATPDNGATLRRQLIAVMPSSDQ